MKEAMHKRYRSGDDLDMHEVESRDEDHKCLS
jgi:hypothetical protein